MFLRFQASRCAPLPGERTRRILGPRRPFSIANSPCFLSPFIRRDATLDAETFKDTLKYAVDLCNARQIPSLSLGVSLFCDRFSAASGASFQTRVTPSPKRKAIKATFLAIEFHCDGSVCAVSGKRSGHMCPGIHSAGVWRRKRTRDTTDTLC